MELSPNIWKKLACPSCGDSLQPSGESIICNGCEKRHNHTKLGQIDLRLCQSKKYSYEFTLGTPPTLASDVGALILEENPSPQVSYKDFSSPNHLTHTLLSYFPKAMMTNALMLDLGCGTAVHKEVAEHAGFEYLGIDFNNPKALYWGTLTLFH